MGDGTKSRDNRAINQQDSLRKARRSKLDDKRTIPVAVKHTFEELRNLYAKTNDLGVFAEILTFGDEAEEFINLNPDVVRKCLNELNADSLAVLVNLTSRTPDQQYSNYLKTLLEGGLVEKCLTVLSKKPSTMIAERVFDCLGNICMESSELRGRVCRAGLFSAAVGYLKQGFPKIAYVLFAIFRCTGVQGRALPPLKHTTSFIDLAIEKFPSDPSEQTYFAAMFESMAKSPQYRPYLASKMQLFKCMKGAETKYVVRYLAYFSDNPVYHNLLVQLKTVPFFIKALNNKDPDVAVVAAETLSRLACTPQTHETLAKNKIVDACEAVMTLKGLARIRSAVVYLYCALISTTRDADVSKWVSDRRIVARICKCLVAGVEPGHIQNALLSLKRALRFAPKADVSAIIEEEGALDLIEKLALVKDPHYGIDLNAAKILEIMDEDAEMELSDDTIFG